MATYRSHRRGRRIAVPQWWDIFLSDLDIQANIDITAERRRLELKRIRSAYLPELVFRLHTALVLSGENFVPRYAPTAGQIDRLCTLTSVYPSNIQKALELSTIVADERYKIYLEFLDNGSQTGVEQNRLPQYLSMVKDANLLRLKHEGTTS
jgi:nuclear pore complex protein Nup107